MQDSSGAVGQPALKEALAALRYGRACNLAAAPVCGATNFVSGTVVSLLSPKAKGEPMVLTQGPPFEDCP